MKYRYKMKNEEALYELEVSKLHIDYAKYISTLLSTFLAGQVTLLGTVFIDIQDKEFAVVAIVLMVVGVMSSFSFAETELRKLRQLEIDKDFPSYAKLRKHLPSRTSIQLFKSFFSAVLVFLSMVCYLVFLYDGGVIPSLF